MSATNVQYALFRGHQCLYLRNRSTCRSEIIVVVIVKLVRDYLYVKNKTQEGTVFISFFFLLMRKRRCSEKLQFENEKQHFLLGNADLENTS